MAKFRDELFVVAAIIYNDCNQVLIAQRANHGEASNLWEFPGGKVEKDESFLEALARELKEELGITLLDSKPYLSLSEVKKSGLKLNLHFYECRRFSGKARALESQQDLKWVDLKDLHHYTFPELNQILIQSLAA